MLFRSNYNKLYLNNKDILNLRFHQELITYKTSELISEGNKSFLWGCKCRSGKTFIFAGIIIKQLKIKNNNFCNLLSYYTRALRNQNLFPEMLEPAGDYSFKLGDLFNKELFFQNAKALGVTETPEASEYYDKSHTAFNHLLESY